MQMDEVFDINDFGGDGLLYFSADWCGPCKVLAPALEELSEELDWLNFYKIPSETNQEMFKKFNISSHPIIILMKSGRKITQLNGVIDMKNNAQEDVARLRRLINSLYNRGG
jgi:thioredoxin 1